MTGPSLPQKLFAAIRLRCPVCCEGAMFRHPLAMHPRCPHCHYAFDLGHGYFLGAMYASYAISVGICAAVGLALWSLGVSARLLIAALCVLAVVVGPLVAFPYSRMFWVWLDLRYLHDGEEDVARLKRLAAERHGRPLRVGLRAVQTATGQADEKEPAPP